MLKARVQRSRTGLGHVPGPIGDRRSSLKRWIAAAVSAFLFASALAFAAPAASPASADTPLDPSQFHGVTWSRLGDNFTADPLVLQGLNGSDSYSTTYSKADAQFTAYQNELGANTVRLPMNPATAQIASYYAIIDAAVAHGFKVVLTYWSQDGTNMVSSSLLPAWDQMWDTVSAHYETNPLVYFDPINEPIGFTTPQWLDFAAAFIARENSNGIPSSRLFIEGAQADGGGWGTDLRPLCNDARFDGVYLAMHRYAFPYGSRTYADWVNDITTYMGNCSSRTVIEEFGVSADTGTDFHATPSGTTDKEVAFLHAITDVIRQYHLGSIWCHTIGGRTSSPDHDTLDNQRLFSAFDTTSTSNVPLWTPNTTAVDLLEYAWGGLGTQTTALRSPYYNKCIDVPGSSTTNGTQVQVAMCTNAGNQLWTRQADNSITTYSGTKCLTALGAGTANGTHVVIEPCTGGPEQKWYFFSDGTVRNVNSLTCLDADLGSATNVQIWSCGSNSNQHWRITGAQVALRAHANGRVVTAESAGAQPLIAHTVNTAGWETFNLIDNSDGTISLQSTANSDYVTAPNSTTALIANSATIGTAQKYNLIFNSDGSVSFQALSNGDYVCADSAGASALIANRTAIGPWESFDFIV
jgi:hypothetical protein